MDDKKDQVNQKKPSSTGGRSFPYQAYLELDYTFASTALQNVSKNLFWYLNYRLSVAELPWKTCWYQDLNSSSQISTNFDNVVLLFSIPLPLYHRSKLMHAKLINSMKSQHMNIKLYYVVYHGFLKNLKTSLKKSYQILHFNFFNLFNNAKAT